MQRWTRIESSDGGGPPRSGRASPFLPLLAVGLLVAGLLVAVGLGPRLTGAGPGAGNALAEQQEPSNARTVGPTRSIGDPADGLGPVRVPARLPAWIDGDPLSALDSLIADGRSSVARELFLRLLREPRSVLYIPPGEDPVEGIAAPSAVLRAWWDTLPPEARDGLRLTPALVEREFLDRPIEDGHPLVWMDGLADLAERRFEIAVEEGDAASAALLARHPGLRSRLHPTLLAWVDAQFAVAPPVPATAPPGAWVLGARTGISLDPEPIDDLEKRPLPDRRRIPHAEVRPIVFGDLAIIPGEPAPRVVELRPPHRAIGELPLPLGSRPTSSGSLRDVPWRGVVAGDRIVLPLPTPKHQPARTTRLAQSDFAWRERGWTEPGLLRIGADSPIPVPLASHGLALEGFTVGSEPLVHRGAVHWIATRGFGDVETWLVTIDLADGRLRHAVPLAESVRAWHSSLDLEKLLPQGRIVPHVDELFVVGGDGWVARVGAQHGDLRGILLHPVTRQDPGTIIQQRPHLFSEIPLRRPRYLADAWIHEDDAGPPLLIVLPPAARQVFAIDIERWTRAWAHPVGPSATMLRDADGIPWVVDLGTRPGASTIEISSFEPRTGRLREPGVVPLLVPGSGPERPPFVPFTPSEADLVPIVLGRPALTPEGLAIPTTEGWCVWSLEPLAGGTPTRILPWPEGSEGGAVWPAGDGRWLVVRRADPVLGTRARLEILEEQAKTPQNANDRAQPPGD